MGRGGRTNGKSGAGGNGGGAETFVAHTRFWAAVGNGLRLANVRASDKKSAVVTADVARLAGVEEGVVVAADIRAVASRRTFAGCASAVRVAVIRAG